MYVCVRVGGPITEGGGAFKWQFTVTPPSLLSHQNKQVIVHNFLDLIAHFISLYF